MNIVLILSIIILLIIDFARLNKKNKKSIYLYIVMVVMILLVTFLDRFYFFDTSPLETGIKIMQPVTNWIEMKLN